MSCLIAKCSRRLFPAITPFAANILSFFIAAISDRRSSLGGYGLVCSL
jgi:hypothetical protein